MCSVNVLSSIQNQLKVKHKATTLLLSVNAIFWGSSGIYIFVSLYLFQKKKKKMVDITGCLVLIRWLLVEEVKSFSYTLRPNSIVDWYERGVIFVFCVVQRKKMQNGQYLRARRVLLVYPLEMKLLLSLCLR